MIVDCRRAKKEECLKQLLGTFNVCPGGIQQLITISIKKHAHSGAIPLIWALMEGKDENFLRSQTIGEFVRQWVMCSLRLRESVGAEKLISRIHRLIDFFCRVVFSVVNRKRKWFAPGYQVVSKETPLKRRTEDKSNEPLSGSASHYFLILASGGFVCFALSCLE